MSNRLFCALLMIGLVTVVRTDDFCQEFRRHQKIDFIFRRAFSRSDGYISDQNILIGGKYWTVRYNKKEGSLKMVDTQSRSSPLFASKGLIGVFFLSWPEHKRHETIFLVRDAEQSITRVGRAVIPNDNFKDPLAMDYERSEPIVIKNLPFIPSFDFVFGFLNRMVMVNKTGSRLSAEVFTFQVSEENIKYQGKDVPKYLSVFNSPYEMLAIGSQSAYGQYDTIVLLKDNGIIYWCLVPAMRNCEPKVFVDCSQSSQRTKDSSAEVTVGKRSLWPFFVIGLGLGFTLCAMVMMGHQIYVNYIRGRNRELPGVALEMQPRPLGVIGVDESALQNPRTPPQQPPQQPGVRRR